MSKAIRVAKTIVYTYTPDLSESYYIDNSASSIEDALKLDQQEVESGEIDIDDFVEDRGVVTYKWEVIDE